MTWSGRAVARARQHARAVLATSVVVCPFCDEPVTLFDRWDLDHVVPRAYGGTDAPHNLRIAHASCNRSAGADVGTARRKGIRRWPP